MFYVITRKTLQTAVLVILLLALMLWLMWGALTHSPALERHKGVVFWPQFMFRQIDETREASGPLTGSQVIKSQSAGQVAGSDDDSSLVVYPPATAASSPHLARVAGPDMVGQAVPATADSLAVEVQAVDSKEAFAEFRWERDRSRSRQLEVLQGIINSSDSSAEQKEAAQNRLLQIMANCEAETRVETLLMTRGFPDAVVVLSESGANIVVDSVLTAEEAAAIGEVVRSITGLSLDKIRIIDGRS